MYPSSEPWRLQQWAGMLLWYCGPGGMLLADKRQAFILKQVALTSRGVEDT